MVEIENLTRQVRRNSDISDARHAGLYSICGLAMRLRDLYKWEHRLPPWKEGDAAHVLEWIGEKEALWETLLDAEYEPLLFNGQRTDPFATRAINSKLRQRHLFFGAGYAHSLKPTFLLAKIKKNEKVKGHTVWQLGQEFARDLLTLPAFSQDGQIVLRSEAGRMYLWDQMAYINKSGRWPLEFAARACGLPDCSRQTLQRHLDTIWKIQKRLYIRHEVGELEEDEFDVDRWRQMLADYPHTPVELLIRSLKDQLADTGPNGALSDLIHHQNKAGLGLYLAFGATFARQLTHPLICAFDAFAHDPNWRHITDAAYTIRETAIQYTRHVLEIYGTGDNQASQDVRREIEARMHEWGLLSRDAE